VVLKPQEMLKCDVLVIGSGGAGLRAAIVAGLKNADTLLVSKSRIGHPTNTYMSKSIIAASGWGVPEDNKDVHMLDTIKGGRYLNDQEKVAMLAERAGKEVAFLKDCGVNFEMEEGKPVLAKIPGHHYARHVHGKNWTGSDLIKPLRRRAEAAGVRFEENVFVTRLLTSEGKISGATGLTADGNFISIQAKAVVLATGGYAQIYLNTNNAAGITGDGLALAFDTGVALKDMEFVQFYPTAMGKRGSRLLLYEKMLVQKGVVLKNSDGEDILRKNDRDPATITRDQLAQLIIKEIKDSPERKQKIIMDLESLSEQTAKELTHLLPSSWWKGEKTYEVVPTTHFCMGGIATDKWGSTSLSALFAVGEVTAGAHGANRLAGNALAEVFSMGSLVGEKAADLALNTGSHFPIKEAADDEMKRLEREFSGEGESPRQLLQELKAQMWNNVGVSREKNELEEALEYIQGSQPRAAVGNPADLIRLLELRNMRIVAEMVCKAALKRTESRGAHFRVDHPDEDNSRWLKNIVFRKGEAGMEVGTTTVCQDLVKP
jgi:succinate dehydrogenase/fumarate reductase flavoprotein subunit